MPAAKKITKEQIEDLYITKNLSKKEVSKELGISESTLLNYAKKFGIHKIESYDKKIELDREELYNLYVVQNMMAKDIAEKFSTTEVTVRRRIKEYGIKRDFVRGERISKDELYKYYIEQNHSMEECVVNFNMSETGIKWYLKKYNIRKDEFARLSKIESTMQERYGVSHALQNNDLLAKRMNTYWNRTEEQNKATTEIRKKTNLNKYGSEYATQSDIVKKKTAETNIDKFGVPYLSQNKDIRKRIEENMISKYGVKNPSQVADFKKKRENTIKNKYGVSNFGEIVLSQEIRDILNSKKNLVKFIKKCKLKTTIDIANEIGCSPTTLNIRINRYNIRDLIDQSSSHYETEISNFLNNIGVKNFKTKAIIPPFEIDFYCPDYKIGIEFNGDYWHSSLQKERMYHYNKSIEASKKGIRIIHIWEHEWNDPQKKPIIESMLKIAFGKVEKKLYARNCEIKEITDSVAKIFNNTNHLQGHRSAQVTYGLFYKDELVQLMSFSQTKYNRNLKNNGSWEIIRGCPGSNNLVVGGVSKLFKHFLREKKPNYVFSYCDFNKFDGRGYNSIGMKFVGYTGPDFKWLMDNGMVVRRSPSKHKELQKKSIAKLWGCGSKKYLWSK